MQKVQLADKPHQILCVLIVYNFGNTVLYQSTK